MKSKTLTKRAVLICSILLITACAPRHPVIPTSTPGTSGNEQIDAIERIQSALEMPHLPLTWTGMDSMANSPSGNLQVAAYMDSQGRKFSVDPQTNTVVEMDARNLLASIPAGAPSFSQDELRERALIIAKAIVPGFEFLYPSLIDDSGGKVDNYFFDLRKQAVSGEMMPPFFQIGFDKSGLIFAYVNTLSLK